MVVDYGRGLATSSSGSGGVGADGLGAPGGVMRRGGETLPEKAYAATR